MKGKVRSLRLQEELWSKIEECAKKCNMSVNAFCALMLRQMCDSMLEGEND